MEAHAFQINPHSTRAMIFALKHTVIGKQHQQQQNTNVMQQANIDVVYTGNTLPYLAILIQVFFTKE